jgi:hypothetical protein
MCRDKRPVLDGLRQEKFNLNLLTDWICLFLKSERGISQSTALLWRNCPRVSNWIFGSLLSGAGQLPAGPYAPAPTPLP